MDPFETFVLRDGATSIVECNLINRDQKAQIFHPASIRICKKSIWQKKIDRDLRNLMIMTISFNASLLPDFTIIFAAAPQHGKTNLRTTFSFSRWAKPPNKEQTLSKTVLMKQTNSEFEVQSFVGLTAHLIAHIFSFQVFYDSGQFNLVWILLKIIK